MTPFSSRVQSLDLVERGPDDIIERLTEFQGENGEMYDKRFVYDLFREFLYLI